QAGGRYGVTPERVALNLDDYRIPDNDGLQPVDVPSEPEGAAALFSTLPVKAMVQAIREAGYPSSLSDSAGTYVCNHVMYGVLSLLAREYPGAKGGFIHVPYSTAQAAQKQNVPGMSLTDMAGSLQAALLAAVCSLNFPFVS
ncbi:MAG: pyroglutamyl-peptidase I, partial [Neglectibacter timonensis]